MFQLDHPGLGISLLFRYSLTREFKPQVMASASMLTDRAANITVTPSIYAQDSPYTTSYHADRDPNAVLDQDAIQVLPPPSDPPTRRDWEAYRTIFTHLYRTENRSLKEVMSIMADQYKFKAT